MSRFDDGNFHLQRARQSEKTGDFLATRMNYTKCVECFRQAEATTEHEEATKEYEAFVSRDPIFKKLFIALNAGIKENPGILQSEITGKFEAMNWGQLYNYDRPIAKDDVYYALYFADKFGYITRNKKGRSYELISNGDPVDLINEIAKTSEYISVESSKPVIQDSPDRVTYVRDTVTLRITAEDIQQARQEKVKSDNRRMMIISLVVIGIVLIICLKVCGI
ncbi:MAG: hypothetical protein LBH44_07560 [Treponema sp.]|jgi:hypothetical protein|nr:hypothetical protein [Treponema sp.]